jgi:hypothetical protein
MENEPCTAFVGSRRVASGALVDVAREAKEYVDKGHPEPVLVFDDQTGRQLEIDFRGSVYDVVGRLMTQPAEPPAPAKKAGRPKLGVVAREVTLLPRHWDWLSAQPGGASVALRKLVEEARRAHAGSDEIRNAQDAAYRVMVALAGDERGFEEATRALYGRDATKFQEMTSQWPPDVRDHARELALKVFA